MRRLILAVALVALSLSAQAGSYVPSALNDSQGICITSNPDGSSTIGACSPVHTCPDHAGVCPTGAHTFAISDDNSTFICATGNCPWIFPTGLPNGWGVIVGARNTGVATLSVASGSTATFDAGITTIQNGKMIVQADDTGNFVEMLFDATSGSPPPPPPPPGCPSANDTLATLITAPDTTSTRCDSGNHVWQFSAQSSGAGNICLRDGIQAYGNCQATKMGIKAGVIYVMNNALNWYQDNQTGSFISLGTTSPF